MYGQKKEENLMYLVLWALLFAAPALSLYLRTLNDSSVSFCGDEIWEVWGILLPFLTAFFIHNFLLAPMLVYSNKRMLYIAACAALLILFQVYQCDFRQHDDRMPRNEMRHSSPPPPPDGGRHEPPDMQRPAGDPGEMDRSGKPPLLTGQKDVVAFIIIIMMLGMNLGMKHYFFMLDVRKRMREREKHSLQQQLEYLKYQVNPHFFMNTLNNIHALVDIDPEQAKTTIEELSKMMRYVLYDAAKPSAPLSREIDFIKRYISLMRIRYTDKVTIHTNLPDTVPDCTVPPLIYITFIENAFKHGISYEQHSFIDTVLTVDNQWIHFSCRNSRKTPVNDSHGGVGLANTRKRLDLIYGRKYTLDIREDEKTYSVELDIPRETESVENITE